MKFTIIKSCLARFSGTFAVGTPSNIHGTALSYRCAKFGAFVNSVTILTLRDLTKVSIWIVSKHNSSESEFVCSTVCTLFWPVLACGIQPPGCFRSEGLAFRSCACLLLHTCSQSFHWLHFLRLLPWAGHFFNGWDHIFHIWGWSSVWKHLC